MQVYENSSLESVLTLKLQGTRKQLKKINGLKIASQHRNKSKADARELQMQCFITYGASEICRQS